MEVRYYLMRAGTDFQVMREGKHMGLHASQESALQSAMFMSSTETNSCGSAIFVEDEQGRLHHEFSIGPATKRSSRTFRKIGEETVLA